MLDLALEQVSEGGQADMWVLADVHAFTRRVGRLQHMVEKHERSDAATFGGRQRPKNRLAFHVFCTGANDQGSGHGVFQVERRIGKA